MMELIFFGSLVGVLSGFFGIGGGTILVPLLLFVGYEMKVAIGISIVQMVFSSIFGSYLNAKKGTLNIKMISYIGFGGFLGALSSGYITSCISRDILEIIFLGFALFALIRMFLQLSQSKIEKEIKPIVLFFIGLPLGAISMTIGVGGSIILVPILVTFLNIELKKATSAGLFFVVFSSISGLLSHISYGMLDYKRGVIIGIASLFGIYIGIQLKEKADVIVQKNLLVVFYFGIVIFLTQRLFF